MPEITTTIDCRQRDGLYELVRNHLGSIEDFWVALERTRDFATAERLGLEFGEDFRLLEDIGWAERDDRDEFELTMSAHDLMELLQRLHGEARVVLGGTEPSPEDAETDNRFQLGYEACEKVQAAIAEGEPMNEIRRGRVPRTIPPPINHGVILATHVKAGPPLGPGGELFVVGSGS